MQLMVGLSQDSVDCAKLRLQQSRQVEAALLLHYLALEANSYDADDFLCALTVRVKQIGLFKCLPRTLPVSRSLVAANVIATLCKLARCERRHQPSVTWICCSLRVHQVPLWCLRHGMLCVQQVAPDIH